MPPKFQIKLCSEPGIQEGEIVLISSHAERSCGFEFVVFPDPRLIREPIAERLEMMSEVRRYLLEHPESLTTVLMVSDLTLRAVTTHAAYDVKMTSVDSIAFQASSLLQAQEAWIQKFLTTGRHQKRLLFTKFVKSPH